MSSSRDEVRDVTSAPSSKIASTTQQQQQQPTPTTSPSGGGGGGGGGRYVPPAVRRRMEEEQRARERRAPARGSDPVLRSPSSAEISDGRRFDASTERRGHRRFDSSDDFSHYRDALPPSVSPPPASAAASAAGPYRRGGGGGGRFGGSGYDRWRHFHDSRHDADRAAQRAAWLGEHAADIAALEAAIAEEDDPYADMTIDVSGNAVPEHDMARFQDLDLGETLDANILRAKYCRPMPVQRAAIPLVLAGRDLMACAQTGSGKTAAFLFPLISSMLLQGPPPPPPPTGRGIRQKAFPQALILAPTRELASQIFDEAQRFAFGSPVRPVVVYGGADVVYQMRELERGCDILVATPGRLVDLIERVRVSLSEIHYLVLDEADRMLDMGFEPQIRRIVEVEDMTPLENRQTLMFSATFPKEIQRLAQDFLRDYLFLTVGRVGSTVSNIIQRLVLVQSEGEKRSAVVDLLNMHPGLTLVFVETKRAADCMEAFLADQGVSVTSIHGDRTQIERETALRDFRDHRITCLVATDVAARGLDIPNVLHVINYDMPSDLDNYVHRIGRTGRARKTGLATAFISERNRPILRDLFDLLQETNQDIPSWFVEMVRSGHGFGGYGGGGGGGRRGGRGRARAYDMRREHGGGGGGGRDRDRDFGRDRDRGDWGRRTSAPSSGGWGDGGGADMGGRW